MEKSGNEDRKFRQLVAGLQIDDLDFRSQNPMINRTDWQVIGQPQELEDTADEVLRMRHIYEVISNADQIVIEEISTWVGEDGDHPKLLVDVIDTRTYSTQRYEGYYIRDQWMGEWYNLPETQGHSRMLELLRFKSTG